MNLIEQLKNAMKAKDAERLSVLRMLHAAIKNKEIELGKKEEGLTDEESAQVLKKEIKKRTKAIEQFKAGNRPDLADQYEREIKVLDSLA